MEKILFSSMLAGLMALGLMAQDGIFKLKGTISDMGPIAFFALTEVDGGVITQETQIVTNGNLKFSYKMDCPGYLMVYGNSGMLFYIPAVPGEEVIVSGTTKDYVFDGSPLYKEYNEVVTTARPLLENYWKYDFKQDCQGEIAGKSSEEAFDLYQSKLYENYQPVTDAVLSFVREHADHESSMMVLGYLNYAEDIEKAAGIISEQVLKGRMNPYYEADMKRVTRRGASNPLLHKAAPDFNLKDIDGKYLSLSSLRGNWVLLHFWSSTCGNATSQFPVLTDCHDKYKDHVVFMGLDCEDDEADWKSAVKNYGLNWVNVLSDYAFDDPRSPVNLYDETATPAYFLVAPSGKLAMKMGSAEEVRYIFKILFE